MWLEKLSQGVLCVLTPLGPRFVKPTLPQRIYLLWIFRNFRALPASVLSLAQQRRIERMCQKQGFISQFGLSRSEDFAVLGTLEQRPPALENLPPKRPPASVRTAVTPVVADAEQQS